MPQEICERFELLAEENKENKEVSSYDAKQLPPWVGEQESASNNWKDTSTST